MPKTPNASYRLQVEAATEGPRNELPEVVGLPPPAGVTASRAGAPRLALWGDKGRGGAAQRYRRRRPHPGWQPSSALGSGCPS